MSSSPVLIIEDDQPIRLFLRTTLSGALLASVEASTGASGLAQARAVPPSLILLDLGLPDVDGIDLIAQIRDFCQAPIIVVSARLQEYEKVAALDAGADDYLTKPFGTEELLARVRAHLRRQAGAPHAQAQTPFSFGHITVDASCRLVTRAGAEVHLTPLEYKLLSVLVEHAGKVLTHGRLLQQAWGPV